VDPPPPEFFFEEEAVISLSRGVGNQIRVRLSFSFLSLCECVRIMEKTYSDDFTFNRATKVLR